MSELERAEARLADARSLVTSITLTTAHWSPEEFYAARDSLIAAAIEVGRLQVLVELESRRSRRLTWEEAERVESALAALAALQSKDNEPDGAIINGEEF